MCIKVILVLIRCASRITHGKNWHYGRILNAHVIQTFLYSVVTRASYRGRVAVEFPFPKKSKFLIIIINGNSEQN